MNTAELARVDRHDHDEVRDVTAASVNQRLDHAAQERVAEYHEGSPEAIERRIDELRREWDMERTLEVNAASLALTGVVLGAALDRRFLAVPAVVLSFLIQHAVQGWCPPIPLFRRLGVRTQREIDREIVALKTLRGDFDDVRRQPSSEHPAQTARAAWEAAKV
jgi:hypothetical protein